MLFMFMPLLVLAQGETNDLLPNASDVVTLITPLIVYAVTFIVTWATGKLPSVLVLMIVVGLSSLTTLITNLLGDPDLAWGLQIVYGLAAVFVDQLLKKLKETS